MIGDILWPVAFAFAVHRFSLAIEKFSPQKHEEATDYPSLSEIPDDLLAVASQENESWAQEEVIRVIRERYEELKDWNKVRRAMGIGVIANG